MKTKATTIILDLIRPDRAADDPRFNAMLDQGYKVIAHAPVLDGEIPRLLLLMVKDEEVVPPPIITVPSWYKPAYVGIYIFAGIGVVLGILSLLIDRI